jgi:hypothetical protein
LLLLMMLLVLPLPLLLFLLWRLLLLLLPRLLFLLWQLLLLLVLLLTLIACIAARSGAHIHMSAKVMAIASRQPTHGTALLQVRPAWSASKSCIFSPCHDIGGRR